MSRAGMGLLSDDDYLSDTEREKRSKFKRGQLLERRLIPGWFKPTAASPLPSGMQVAVIGGGFASLYAAWYLAELGVATTVFEASAEIGGRVKTDHLFIPKKIVELGAELIGENHPLWGWLAIEKFNLPLVPLTGDKKYEADGLNVRMRFGDTVLDASQESLLYATVKRAFVAIGRDALLVSETEPWKSPRAGSSNADSIADRFDRVSVATSIDFHLRNESSDARKLARDWFRFTLANDNCVDIAKQSYLGLLASVSAARMGDDEKGMFGYWMSTETHRCGGGNILLAEHLARKSDVRIRSSVELVRINPDQAASRRVQIVSSVEDHQSSHRTELFDYAILTAPPTVWNAITFSPSLKPEGWTIQDGNAVKFFSRYGDKFWAKSALAPSAKWDQLGSVWEGTDKQGVPPHFNDPDFCLTVFSGGPHVLSSAKEYATRLSKLYPPGFSLLSSGGKPKDEKFVDWSTMQHIKTGYAVPGVGQVTTISRNQIVPHAQRLFCAGEQSSPGFFGYMEGALQSGARAARDIVLSAINIAKKRS